MNVVAIIITFVAVIAIAATLSPLPPPEKDCFHTHFRAFSGAHPICGSDNVTYTNQPHLDYENCINDRSVTVVKEGYCDEEEGRRVQERHRKFMAEYAKQIRKAIKEGRPIPYIADALMPNLDDYPEEEDESTEEKTS